MKLAKQKPSCLLASYKVSTESADQDNTLEETGEEPPTSKNDIREDIAKTLLSTEVTPKNRLLEDNSSILVALNVTGQ